MPIQYIAYPYTNPDVPPDPPIRHTSTPSILNFSPDPLNGSFPNAGHRDEIPFSNTSSRNSPYLPSLRYFIRYVGIPSSYT